MKRIWTIIGVRDVRASFKWYQSLFGQPPTDPAHDHFGQIVDDDGTVLLCLHSWGEHEHPPLYEIEPGHFSRCHLAQEPQRRQQPHEPLVSRS